MENNSKGMTLPQSAEETSAFEEWSTNGKTQLSSIYIGDEAESFISRHYESGTFAKLHTFDSLDECKTAYDRLNSNNIS